MHYFETMSQTIDQCEVGGVTDQDMDQTLEYSVETSNQFAALNERGQVGYRDIVNDENNPNKRKRCNTGSTNIDFDNFQSMSQDDKLSAMFAKLSNIEIAQAEMRSTQQQVDRTTDRLERTILHVDINTYRNQLLAYKYLDLETRFREKNIIMYGLEEKERDGTRLAVVLRDFFSEFLGLEDDDLYIVYAHRLGRVDNNRRRAPRRPILCSFCHYSEVDLVMSLTRRLRNTGCAIDRDYPPEIATARKKLWPDVKQMRRDANTGDSIQLKYPAKIVHNGRTVKDAFPHWEEIIKSNIGADFQYIGSAVRPQIRMNQPNEPLTPCNDLVNIATNSVTSFFVPDQQGRPTNGRKISLQRSVDNMNTETTQLRVPQVPSQPVTHSVFNSPCVSVAVNGNQLSRPQTPYMANQQNNKNDLPTENSNQNNESQHSPSLLAHVSNNVRSSESINSSVTNRMQNNMPQANSHISRQIGQINFDTRDRSQSVEKHEERGWPRNISKNSPAKTKSRSRSVKSRGSSITRVGGKPNVPKSVNEQMAPQNI